MQNFVSIFKKRIAYVNIWRWNHESGEKHSAPKNGIGFQGSRPVTDKWSERHSVYPLLIPFEEAASAQKGWESGMEPSPVVAESPQGTTKETTELHHQRCHEKWHRGRIRGLVIIV